MELTTDFQSPDGPVIKIVGEVDLASADQVRDAGRVAVDAASPGGQIAIDLREVTFLDSTGVGALVDVTNRAEEGKIRVVLRSAPERVRRILQITGLLDRFTLED